MGDVECDSAMQERIERPSHEAGTTWRSGRGALASPHSTSGKPPRIHVDVNLDLDRTVVLVG
jgi:hypothetical protein